MPLQEYKRKRRFDETPEPPPKVEGKTGRRFVVQKHRASHLHYDFRLEMEGVLKSWAVPKGPSLNPADKRLAMMVEDHPVSYFHFEGVIPPGNYGAGTVMVWDTGSWEPLGDAAAMLKKGDLKFRLQGDKLKGEFVLAHMRSRRPGSKGTEWLLIKKRDNAAKPGYDIDKYDYSVLTKRSLEEIASDEGSAEWESNRKAKRSSKSDWLDESVAKAKKKAAGDRAERLEAKSSSNKSSAKQSTKKTSLNSAKPSSAPASSARNQSGKATPEEISASDLESVAGAARASISTLRGLRPMLATLVDEPFDDQDWLFEVKWDGYRALAYIENGRPRLVSRNQNEFTSFSELRDLPKLVQATSAILDGEIVALDEQGRPSFSLMQQRMSNEEAHRRTGIPVAYYAFDLLYLDGYSLLRVDLEKRKQLLQSILNKNPLLRFSDHFAGDGIALYEAAKQRGLEGIVAKQRQSCYLQKRSREWLKIKISNAQECVIGGYTDPRGSREHFGSLVLGLYDEKNRLVPVGQAGSGFTHETHAQMWKRLRELETVRSPFFGKPESTRRVHWLRPELVAQIKFSEWTHEGRSGAVRMRAPVFQGLRTDKKPEECRIEIPKPAAAEVKRATRERASA